MAVQYDKSDKLFQIDYQSPFGGIDSSAYASAIDPHNFASMSNLIVNANILLPVAWSEVMNQFQLQGNFLGYIPVVDSSVLGYIITTSAVITVASNGTGGVTYSAAGSYTPAVSTYGYFSYVVIDNQLIWTSETWSEMWTFDIATSAITNNTTYCGGGFLGVLSDQLINLGGISAADGATPYRVSWSAPGEYSVFTPYDASTNTGNYAAGFNDLPATSDILQGFMVIGTVGYIFRSQGITQMNPTGNGVEPFSFYDLWASQVGVGTICPDSIAQYGASGGFVSDSGIYTLGLGGLSEISGAAKDLLYGLINNISNFSLLSALPQGIVTACCVPYLDTHPSIYYVLGIANAMTPASGDVAPSVASYAVYAIDVNNNSNCYSLGTIPVIEGADTPSTRAVGKLSFINKNYSSAPVPTPTVTQPTIQNQTANLTATSSTILANPDYEVNGTQLRTVGSVGNNVNTNYVVATGWGFSVPADATIVGVAPSVNWVGQATASGIMTSLALYYEGAIIGDALALDVSNTTTNSVLTEGSDSDAFGYALTPTIVNDPSFGAGWEITTGTASSSRSFFNGFSLTVYYTLPVVLPAFSPVNAFIASIVPLFVAINNGLSGANLVTLTASELLPTTTGSGTAIFRKEQLQFAYVPTVTRIGFIAALIDPDLPGSIQVSIDGGAHYGNYLGPNGESLGFDTITTFPGFLPQSSGDPFSTVFSDGVVSIERPQLAIILTNVQVAEVWYQGTLADFPVI